jgi:hypothetical protein
VNDIESITQRFVFLSRNALLTTEIELKLIAALAMMGLSSMPKREH